MKRTLTSLILLLILLSPSYSKTKTPKNEKVDKVILLIGDGMGLDATAAWMVYRNYAPTAFDRAQFVGICKTYSANNRVTDSAAAATAMGTGHKTVNGRLGMLPDSTVVENLGELAKANGLSLGIVVSSYVQDATPAGFYAHVLQRGDRSGIDDDIIRLRPDVLVGGGRKYMTHEKYVKENKLEKAIAAGFTYVSSPDEFYRTDKTPILGLFSEEGFPMVGEHDEGYLKDAMEHTLEILGRNKKGFFAMIEGSDIDHAAHANNTEQLMLEIEEFDQAVNAAMDYADTHKGTLVLVVADHETGGMALPSGSKDFTKGDSGVDVKYITTGHTGSPVVLYAYGASAWQFSGVMENTDVFKKIKRVLFEK